MSTYEQLMHRGLFHGSIEGNCVYCINTLKSLDHLPISCPFSMMVWGIFFSWLGMNNFVDSAVIAHLLRFVEGLKGKGKKQNILLFWLATCWAIWLSCNNMVFNNTISTCNILLTRAYVCLGENPM